LPPENQRITQIIQQFCTDHVFERKTLPNNKEFDVYRTDWLQAIGSPTSEERISKLTLGKIHDHVKDYYPEIKFERTISNTGLSFDMYHPPTSTAFEICLGAITKEFHKDVLKAMLDQETHTLFFMFREYTYGRESTVLGKKWFEHPAQKELINLIAIHKLRVIPSSLVLSAQ